jgi:hypothetical protein
MEVLLFQKLIAALKKKRKFYFRFDFFVKKKKENAFIF